MTKSFSIMAFNIIGSYVNLEWYNTYENICCWLCIHLANYTATGRMRHMVNVETEYDWFEFRVFFLLDWLPDKG